MVEGVSPGKPNPETDVEQEGKGVAAVENSPRDDELDIDLAEFDSVQIDDLVSQGVITEEDRARVFSTLRQNTPQATGGYEVFLHNPTSGDLIISWIRSNVGKREGTRFTLENTEGMLLVNPTRQAEDGSLIAYTTPQTQTTSWRDMVTR